MATLEDVQSLVTFYEKTYRHPDLAPFDFINPVKLGENPICPPKAARSGVYIIFSGKELLYIGKSSSKNKAIWHRIVDHIYSNRKSKWYAEATHFVGWAVLDDSPFEASALEEFLIFKLRNTLKYNTVGK